MINTNVLIFLYKVMHARRNWITWQGVQVLLGLQVYSIT